MAKEKEVKLGETVDIVVCEKLLEELRQLVESAGVSSVVVNAADVSRITTPCVQLILSLEKVCLSDGVGFKVINISEGFRDCFVVLGFSDKITKWS